MRLFNIRGRLVYKNVQSCLIDWDKKSRSKLQFKIKQFFKPYWCKYVVYEEFPVYGTRLKIDLLNASKKIAIEVQGVQHSEFNPFFHKTRTDYFFSIQRDVRKNQWIEKNGFKFLELIETDLDKLSPEYILEKFGIYIL